MAGGGKSTERNSRHSVRQKHKALLIGISGSSTLDEDYPPLKTAHRDVNLVRNLLVDSYGYENEEITVFPDAGKLKTTHRNVKLFRNLLVDLYGYRDEDITVLIDNGIHGDTQPTRVNIMKAMANLVKHAEVGDRYCFYYSGPSMQFPHHSNSEQDWVDECLVPVDGVANRIMDNELKAALLSPLPVGSHLVAILETSYHGSLLGLGQHSAWGWPARLAEGRRSQMDSPERSRPRRKSEPLHSESVFELPLAFLPYVRWVMQAGDIIPWVESPLGASAPGHNAIPTGGAYIISLVFRNSSWAEESKKMIPVLVGLLRRNPNQSLKELLSSISHHADTIGDVDLFERPVLSSSRPLDMQRSAQSLFCADSSAIVDFTEDADGEDIIALHTACMEGDLDTVQLLLGHEDINGTGEKYRRALRAASMSGHSAIVAFLLGNVVGADAPGEEVAGAPMDHDKFGDALQAASVRGHVDTVRILLEHGATVNSMGAQFVDVLRTTLREGHTDVDNQVALIVTDINKRSTLISLPMENCRSWAAFRDGLIEEGVQPWQYIQTDEFVIRVEGPTTQLVSQEDWIGWISLLCSASTVYLIPWVTVCIIRRENEPCCNSPSENIDGSKWCESCGMAIVNLPAKQDFSASTPRHSAPTILASSPPQVPQPLSGTSQSGQPSVTLNHPAASPPSMRSSASPPTQTFVPPPEPFSAVPSHFATAARTTAFELTAENSVMRRRNRRASISTRSQASSAERDDHDRTALTVNAQRPTPWIKIIALGVLRRSFGGFARVLKKTAKWLVRIIGNCFLSLYSFIIAPPFLIHKGLEWDRARLENRLAIFQWTMAGNLSLAGLCAALLALTSLKNNSVAQSFVILSGIFSVFGLIYTAFLALHMGDSKEKFCAWFLKQEHIIHTSGSMWNLTIMMSLPLTWMSWALLNLCLGGLSYPIVQLQNHKIPDSDTAPFTKVQVAIFAAALVASVLGAFMIHLEIRKYGLSLQPRCNDTGESLNGDRNNVESNSISRV
ncbi:Metacaspase type II [Mycena sanguinolenta]|uniref:Metacaspase type II n=1 Tax=Mycena sanguinolenta TaxID=230812 RepID=A0A8H7CY81_9AGAR|nr:Metacaspase type II [Mycena sanguinolenta]